MELDKRGIRVAIAAVVVAATLAGTIARPTAQQATGRVNRIIAQYEQGKPAIVDERWDWIEMEQNPWTIVGLRARLTALQKGRGAPVLPPVLRIPPDALRAISLIHQAGSTWGSPPSSCHRLRRKAGICFIAERPT